MYTRPSREPYLNTYIDRLRQEITDETLTKLKRLSNNTDKIIKPADKGGATLIMNTEDYVKEAKLQLDNEVYYKRVE